eukprot:TRINITY_DN9278_c0_g1_i1.p1 TRINITY_DN9278_c0_g1~~TRINITY_DN9278_c0_g1_i1.p1  ORF type:complete len:117 (-),score=0.23 TRINITY_DN9278_c0_g1_i1:230-580(-)
MIMSTKLHETQRLLFQIKGESTVDYLHTSNDASYTKPSNRCHMLQLNFSDLHYIISLIVLLKHIKMHLFHRKSIKFILKHCLFDVVDKEQLKHILKMEPKATTVTDKINIEKIIVV